MCTSTSQGVQNTWQGPAGRGARVRAGHQVCSAERQQLAPAARLPAAGGRAPARRRGRRWWQATSARAEARQRSAGALAAVRGKATEEGSRRLPRARRVPEARRAAQRARRAARHAAATKEQRRRHQRGAQVARSRAGQSRRRLVRAAGPGRACLAAVAGRVHVLSPGRLLARGGDAAPARSGKSRHPRQTEAQAHTTPRLHPLRPRAAATAAREARRAASRQPASSSSGRAAQQTHRAVENGKCAAGAAAAAAVSRPPASMRPATALARHELRSGRASWTLTRQRCRRPVCQLPRTWASETQNGAQDCFSARAYSRLLARAAGARSGRSGRRLQARRRAVSAAHLRGAQSARLRARWRRRWRSGATPAGCGWRLACACPWPTPAG